MLRLELVAIKRTTLITIHLVCLLLGIGAANILTSRVYDVPFSVFLIPFALYIGTKRKASFLTISFLLCLFAGFLRGGHFLSNLNVYDSVYKKQVVLHGLVDQDGGYNKYKQISFVLKNIELENGQSLPGKIQVSGFGTNAIYEGDTVQVSGKLYPGYSSYQGRLNYASVQVVKRGDSLIAKLRRKFSAGISNALPEPAAPFAMGILIGQRSTLPEEIKKDLLMVGLTHIIAVSGYNLTIILEASKKIIRSSKRLSTFLSFFLVGIFLLITGSSASIVRAAIVSTLSLVAGYHGRRIKPLIIILLAAVITCWSNPVYIWSDIGWYLSFLAFFGVLIIAPIIKERFRLRIFESIVGSVALESICAEIMALPYVVHMFGQMSLIGLIANVLIVGLVPLAMLLSLVSGIAGVAFSGIAPIIAWPASVLLSAMLSTAHVLASIPGIFIENINLNLFYLFAFYTLTLITLMVLRGKTKSLKYDNLTDRS